ncbi:MAG: cyclic nucleotide-binding domain-containing protein [Acidobacteriota bacterium]
MSPGRGYEAIFVSAGERWLGGDRGALDTFEKGIEAALDEGDVPAALAAHQSLLGWVPDDRARHGRVARAIAAALDRIEQTANARPSIETIPLFSGVPREELVSVLRAVQPIRLAAGQSAVREGDAGDSLYLVVSGTLAATTGDGTGMVEIGRLGAGDFFGEVSLLTGRPRTATVTAVTAAELLRLDRGTVASLRERHPEIDASLAEFHRRRAEKTIEALLERRSRGGA